MLIIKLVGAGNDNVAVGHVDYSISESPGHVGVYLSCWVLGGGGVTGGASGGGDCRVEGEGITSQCNM